MNHFHVKGGISGTIIPTEIVTGDNIHYIKILVYRLDSNFRYMRKTLLEIATSHVPKVLFAWYQAEIYKADSNLLS